MRPETYYLKGDEISKFLKGRFIPKFPEKYIGNKTPMYRSSWEFAFMRFLDSNPGILKWASESIRIPYMDPTTNRPSSYVPDFFIQYVDKGGKIHTEVIEIKPANQTVLERVGKNKLNQIQYIKNMAKWKAANVYCSKNGMRFRILTENDLFFTGR